MNVKRSVRFALTSLATAAAIAPMQLLAAEATNSSAKLAAAIQQPATKIVDVSLAENGLLVGQVFDTALQPMANAKVAIQTGGHTLATTTTDAQGTFAVTGLRGGVHQISTGASLETCRLWTEGTAPPAAKSAVRIIPGQDEVVRGQYPGQYTPRGIGTWTSNPWVVGGVVGAAVVGPILIHNLDDDEDSGS